VTPNWAGCTSLPRKTIRGTTPGYFLSGIVRIVNSTDSELGWMYEFATEDNQRYDTWAFFCGIVRIVNSTDSELGWMYEFATEDNQRYTTLF
jgi:hypothetical protein